jgi:hypothetical protein
MGVYQDTELVFSGSRNNHGAFSVVSNCRNQWGTNSASVLSVDDESRRFISLTLVQPSLSKESPGTGVRLGYHIFLRPLNACTR